MKLKHNVGFVGGSAVTAGTELTKKQESDLAKSGQKVCEAGKDKVASLPKSKIIQVVVEPVVEAK